MSFYIYFNWSILQISIYLYHISSYKKTTFKMKKNYWLSGLILPLCFISCIQEEALNVEAAIDGCKGSNIQLVSINNEKKVIEIYVPSGTDLSQQELIFELPEGATVSTEDKQPNDNPPSYDFSIQNNRKFIVTSEDKSTNATYHISIVTMELPLLYSFENLVSTDPYHIIYLNDQTKMLQWASGNPGFKLTGMGNNATDYPSVQASDGKKGYCVKLTTRDTGSFGSIPGMPIAPGNLFIGSFDLTNALSKPLEATLFGYPFTKVPTKMTGYYKYKAGPQMTDAEKKPISGTDKFDMYAVMYEAEESDFFLNGENSLTDKSIVKLARIKTEDAKETDEWTYFEIPFETSDGKTIDSEKLKNGKYKLGIVLSSSLDGAYFEGAVGSTLYVDELEIVCETNN